MDRSQQQRTPEPHQPDPHQPETQLRAYVQIPEDSPRRPKATEEMTVQWMVVGALFESTAALEEEEVALDPTSLTPCYTEQERTGCKANQKFI